MKDFDTIFRLYYTRLLFFARQYVDDEDECKDIVSDVFEVIWKKREQIDEKTLLSFLYTNVKNRAIDHLRHQQKMDGYVDYVQNVSKHATMSNNSETEKEMEEVAMKLVNELGEPTQSILRACYIDGKKYREVAAEMHISISTVKKHIVKALKFFRQEKKKIIKDMTNPNY